MKVTLKLIAKLVVLNFMPALVFAAATPSALPADLLYRGKPIDSLCFGESSSGKNKISLTQCGISAEKNYKVSGKSDELVNKGFTGYDFSYQMDNSPASNGYSYYKSFGKTGDKIIVFSIYNGGGSGIFTNLSLIKRNGDDILLSTILSGDRCNNGIYDVNREDSGSNNALLTYHVNLTSFDFLILANDNPHHLQPYDNLDACAACCKASAIFTRKIGPDFTNEKLNYVDLDSYPADSSEAAPTQNYQACFDKLIDDYKKKGMHHLNMQQLKEFTNAFNLTCIK